MFIVEKYNNTGNLSSDIRARLSAIHANTDTCMDQFEGTDEKMKDKFATKIDSVDSLVYNLLTKVEHTMSDDYVNCGQYPSWFSLSEQQLLQPYAERTFDVVVAADHTRNFSNIMDVVNAAPDSTMNRHIIFIKKGVYHENVQVLKKNIVMIGDGMDATIITGNLSNATSNLSTINTATFGKDLQISPSSLLLLCFHSLLNIDF